MQLRVQNLRDINDNVKHTKFRIDLYSSENKCVYVQ